MSAPLFLFYHTESSELSELFESSITTRRPPEHIDLSRYVDIHTYRYLDMSRFCPIFKVQNFQNLLKVLNLPYLLNLSQILKILLSTI